jgi:hypothetical protein
MLHVTVASIRFTLWQMLGWPCRSFYCFLLARRERCDLQIQKTQSFKIQKVGMIFENCGTSTKLKDGIITLSANNVNDDWCEPMTDMMVC